MNRTALGLLAVAAITTSLSAHAQLTSSVVTDSDGLMWANTVGLDVGWNPNAEAGTAQGWVAGLNAENYGGYNDWTLATGYGLDAPNTTTNQLGELFYSDCGNSPGSDTVLNNPGKNCAALSAIQQDVLDPLYPLRSGLTLLIFSGTPDHALDVSGAGGPPFILGYWVYSVLGSGQGEWNQDTVSDGLVGIGDALAVREVNQAPEIDPNSAVGGLALLLGGLAVLCGRREKITA